MAVSIEERRKADTDALAALAAAGDMQALAELWTLHRGLLCLLCRKWYSRHRDMATAHGLTLEDLEQEAFFVLKYAVDHYAPAKGAFTTMLGFAFKHHIRGVLCGDHMRVIRDDDGKTARVASNPLNGCISLDEAPPGTDELTRADMIEDPAAQDAFDRIEERYYTEQLHAALEEALDTLTEREAQIIRARYFEGKTTATLGSEMGVNKSRIQQIERAALHKLAHKEGRLRQFRAEISGRVYRGTGFTAWEQSGSVEERLAELLESADEMALKVKWS